MFKKWVIGITSLAFVSLGGMSAVIADHEAGTINCGNFDTGEEVYEFWTSHGYNAGNDPEGLDRDSDGLPCEGLTSSMESQFLAYESGEESATDEETTEEEVTEEDTTDEESTEEAGEETAGSEESSDEGDALPATASSYPMMILFGLLTAGAGAFMLIRRKVAQT